MNDKETNVLTNERPYTLRRLKDGDMWPVLDIIGKVFPDDLAQVFAQMITGEKNIRDVGAIAVVQMVVAVLKNMNRVHDEVYDFLSSVSGIPAKDIEEMEIGTTPMMIWDIVKNEKNAGFFEVVSKLS